MLLGIKVNDEAKLESGVFDTSTPKDWDVIIQPFRGAIEGDDAPVAPAAGPNIQPAGTDRQNPAPNPASNSGSNPGDKPK
jgi:hypothetical protein